MTDAGDAQEDLTLKALTTLSEVTLRTVDELNAVTDDLVAMQRRRRRGWSWRRILSSAPAPNPLTSVAGIASNLGRASGDFRRALIRSLRIEGMRITEVATLLEVSRQRVSALVHSKRTS
jgi:hypothetical protein